MKPLPFPLSELYIALGMVFVFLPVVVIFTRVLGSREPPVQATEQNKRD
jgi:hypothetical protein